jgi:hypothetical protein
VVIWLVLSPGISALAEDQYSDHWSLSQELSSSPRRFLSFPNPA